MALVMFDYDGVIADSFYLDSQDCLAAFRENGLEQVDTTEKLLDLLDDNFYVSLANYGLDEEAINKIMDSYAKRQALHLPMIEMFAGMPAALQRIAENNKVYIISSNVSEAILEVLQRYELDCIAEVIGADHEKSKIVKIKNLIARYPNLTPYYVGDTKGDILEGKEAGAKVVGVAWGWHDKERLSEAEPEYIANSPRELAEYLVLHST